MGKNENYTYFELIGWWCWDDKIYWWTFLGNNWYATGCFVSFQKRGI